MQGIEEDIKMLTKMRTELAQTREELRESKTK